MAKKSKVKIIYQVYGYSTIDGKEQYGRYEKTEDDEWEFVAYGRYIAIERVARDIDGGSPILTIGFDTLYGKRDTVNMSRELLSKKKEVQALLLKCYADAYDSSLNTLMNCLHVSEENAERGQCFHRTGWIVENVGTDKECLHFKGNGLISSSDDESADYVGQYDLGTKGTFEAWKDVVATWILGRPAL